MIYLYSNSTLSLFVCITLFCSTNLIYTIADENEEYLCNCDNLVTQKFIDEHKIESYEDILEFYKNDQDMNSQLEAITTAENVSTYASSSLPSSVDLSASNYFPPIGNQGSQGSCVAFASTYYQFTYEMNKLHDTTVVDNSNIASPAYVFNMMNQTETDSTWITVDNAYNFLEHMGCVSLSEMNYSPSDDTTWLTDVEASRNALKCRVSSKHTITINDSAVIESPSDSDLYNVKLLLSYGKVLMATTTNDYEMSDNNIIYRFYDDDDSGHALAIVGYNDNIYYDVNKDGKIENAERGAFKIANSWGTDWGDAGYAWVLYDALNEETRISRTWENNLPERRQAFDNNSILENVFYLIYVKDMNVKLVAEVGFTSNRRKDVSLTLYKDYQNGTYGRAKYETILDKIGRDGDFSGTLVFDCEGLIDNLETDLISKKWIASISDAEIGYYTKNITYAITDDMGNYIAEYDGTEVADNETIELELSLDVPKGDVNYDGKISAEDALLVEKKVVKLVEFSNVQQYVGDYDNDGDVDILDAQSILRRVVGLE